MAIIAEMTCIKYVVFLSFVLTLSSSGLPAAEEANVERTINQGLSWLVKQQGDDGRWRFGQDRGTAGDDVASPNEAVPRPITS